MKRPSSTNRKVEMGIFRFFKYFSKTWKIGERVEPYPTPTSTLHKEEEENIP